MACKSVRKPLLSGVVFLAKKVIESIILLLTHHSLSGIIYHVRRGKGNNSPRQKGSMNMKIRWTTYKKDAASYWPINSTEMCLDTDMLHQFTQLLGFAVTNPSRPDCYWRITSYDSAEMLQIIEE